MRKGSGEITAAMLRSTINDEDTLYIGRSYGSYGLPDEYVSSAGSSGI